jgi:hypothetical protein
MTGKASITNAEGPFLSGQGPDRHKKSFQSAEAKLPLRKQACALLS